MKVPDYINSYTLNFKNPYAEREFSKMRNQEIKYYNKLFSLFFLISTLANAIITTVSIEKARSIEKLFINNVILLSYVALAVGCLCLILSIFVKNIKVLKTVGYLIFIGFILPFYNISRVVWEIYEENKDLYSLLAVFHLMPKIFMMFYQILSFLDSIFVSILEILILFVYFYFTGQFHRVIYSTIFMVLQIIFSYFITRKIKENLLYVWASNDRKRYQSIFENMKSYFLNFSNKKIKFLNRIFQTTIMKHMCIKNIHEQSKIKEIPKESRKNSLYKLYEIQKENIDYNYNDNIFIQEYSEQILNVLLDNIKTDSHELSNNNIDSFIKEQNSIFSLDKFLFSRKENYINKQIKGNFMFLGFKEMRLICREDSDKTEKRVFEVYFRVIIQEEEEYELMFNDISDIKENEEKIAELKYKTLFLSKVAHEFKNPLI